MYQERRVKAFSIGEPELLDLFSWGIHRVPREIYRLKHPELPKKGATVVSVHHDWWTRTINFVVFHPEFEEVPPGQVIPRVPGNLEVVWERVEVLTSEAESDHSLPRRE